MTVDEHLRSEVASRLTSDAARHRCITANCKSSRHRCACGVEWEDKECSGCRGRGHIGAPEAAQFGKAPTCPICEGTGRCDVERLEFQ